MSGLPRCPHCPASHDAEVRICPATNLPIESSSTRVAIPIPIPSHHLPPSWRDAAPPSLVGKVVSDRYRIRGVIGKGGMGTVYDAEQIALARPVALKVLDEVHAPGSTAAIRFENEARAAGGLGHPNICEVYDFGALDDGRPFLVLERLVGVTLSERVRANGVLSVHAAADHFVELLSALSAAHAKGILHRDVKPENVFLIRRHGREDMVKLLDFGLAKILSNDLREGEMDLTQVGLVVGTPAYMSPEQALGEKTLDERIDLYSCGVALYEVLTNALPFTGRDRSKVLAAIVRGRYRPAGEIRPNLPLKLQAVLTKAMASSPAARFQTAIEFQEALKPFCSNAATVPRARIVGPSAGENALPSLAGADDDDGLPTELNLPPLAGFEVADDRTTEVNRPRDEDSDLFARTEKYVQRSPGKPAK